MVNNEKDPKSINFILKITISIFVLLMYISFTILLILDLFGVVIKFSSHLGVIILSSVFFVLYLISNIYLIVNEIKAHSKNKTMRAVILLNRMSCILIGLNVLLKIVFNTFDISFQGLSDVIILVASILLFASVLINLLSKEKIYRENRILLEIVCLVTVMFFILLLNFYSNRIIMILISLLTSFILIVFIFKTALVDKIKIKTTNQIIIFILIILITVVINIYTLYLLFWVQGSENQNLFNAIVGVYGCLIGGVLTLAGVSWTIKWTQEYNFRRDKDKIKPLIALIDGKNIQKPQIGKCRVFPNCKNKNNVYTIKLQNIGEKACEIVPAYLEESFWILPSEEFYITVEMPKNKTDIYLILFRDIMGDSYFYRLTFENLTHAKNFICVKEF